MPRNTFVHELMTRRIVTVHPGDSIASAAQVLTKHRISSVPVVDSDGVLVGTFSEKHCMRIVILAAYDDHPEGTVAEYMRCPAPAISEGATMLQAAELFNQASLRRIAVVDHHGHLVGVLSRHDLLRSFVEYSVTRRKESFVRRENSAIRRRPRPGL